MYCSNCGQKILEDSSNYCSNCGFSLGKQIAETHNPIQGPGLDNKDEHIGTEVYSKAEDGPEMDVDNAGVISHDNVTEGKVCPNCKLNNPATTMVCDCGYTFQTGKTVKADYVTKPMRKWGWGWYILSGLFWTYGKKSIPNDTIGNLALLIGTAIALILYFYLRKNFFKGFKEPGTRSLTAGIISYIIAALVTYSVTYIGYIIIKGNS